MQTMKKHANHGISAFELTQKTLRNLNKFNLTPVAKLVLLELITHLNEDVNGSVVFPSIEYIANVLGIGLTATKKAINDLINEGLLIKSKRSKIKGNYNKYLLTPKVQKTTSEQSQNELFKQSDSDCFMITNNHEKIKNKQQKDVVVLKTIQSNKIVTLEDVPESIKSNNKIKNKCAYWASLSEEVKKSYLQKKTIVKNDGMLRKAQQVIKDLEYAKENSATVSSDYFANIRANLCK